MKTLSINQIRKLQEKNGLDELQRRIESGLAWHLEGSYGRTAMEYIERGACFLPDEVRYDYWGNRVPARSELKDGTKGTLKYSINFWVEHLKNDDSL